MKQAGVEAAFAEAISHHRAGRLERAVELYEAVSKSALTVNLAFNLGCCLSGLGRSAEAERWLRRALEHRPDDAAIRLALAEVLLSLGRYAEGWPLYEARIKPGSAPIGPNPEWQGEALDGRHIVVIAEQGLGDQIQFARFAPMLKAAGAGRVTLTCQPPLARLLRSTVGADDVIPTPSSTKTLVHGSHLWVRYMSVPGRLGVDLDNLPAEPYLSARPREIGARIGVMGEGNPAHPRNSSRSLDLAARARLRDLPGAVWLGPDGISGDLQDIAEVVAGLDLVVTVDTAFAHLAGALGKPVWVLLDYACDWRWMRGRTDTPWYPTARLFRQPEPGDWASVMDEVEGLIAAS